MSSPLLDTPRQSSVPPNFSTTTIRSWHKYIDILCSDKSGNNCFFFVREAFIQLFKRLSKIGVTDVILQSDGGGKHFKQRYTLAWMTTVRQQFGSLNTLQWNFWTSSVSNSLLSLPLSIYLSISLSSPPTHPIILLYNQVIFIFSGTTEAQLRMPMLARFPKRCAGCRWMTWDIGRPLLNWAGSLRKSLPTVNRLCWRGRERVRERERKKERGYHFVKSKDQSAQRVFNFVLSIKQLYPPLPPRMSSSEPGSNDSDTELPG